MGSKGVYIEISGSTPKRSAIFRSLQSKCGSRKAMVVLAGLVLLQLVVIEVIILQNPLTLRQIFGFWYYFDTVQVRTVTNTSRYKVYGGESSVSTSYPNSSPSLGFLSATSPASQYNTNASYTSLSNYSPSIFSSYFSPSPSENITSLAYSPTSPLYLPMIVSSNYLLNMTNFTYIQNPRNICNCVDQQHRQQNILISIIQSARENFLSRELIRQTWGSVKSYKNWTIVKVFLLGIESENAALDFNITVADKLSNESQQFGDIVMGNFVDTYRNMTYKHVMGYKWVLEHCQCANFVLKADDDVLVDIFNVINYLIGYKDKANANAFHDFYYCPLNYRSPAIRFISKWQVTKEEYPLDEYPPYCGFGAYLTSVNVITRIYDESLKKWVPYFWIDDVFVTGQLREKVNTRANQTNSSSIEIVDAYDKLVVLEVVNLDMNNFRWNKDLYFVIITRKALDLMTVIWKFIVESS